eukprot:scaffold853_cov103-Cylindrotheca_fusiformis.AAC.2
MEPLRLQELCRDNDRVSSLVSVHSPAPDRMLVVDLSRQRMNLDTLNHLLRLASARGVRKYITRLAWGENDPDNPTLPNRTRNRDRTKSKRLSKHSTGEDELPISSFYLSLRAPEGSKMLNADGTNALRKIHHEWDRIKQVSDSIRRGQLPGVTGSMLRDVVVVGRGVPVMALRFVYLALCKDETATIGRKAGLNDINNRLRGGGGIRRIKFLTSVDPVRAAGVVGALDPATTIVISIALTGTEETSIATNTLKTWLLQSLGNGRKTESVLSKHMMLVTGNRKISTDLKRESLFFIPESTGSEPFSTFTAASLLVGLQRIKFLLVLPNTNHLNFAGLNSQHSQPLSIVFGWPITKHFLDGAHTMDSHFVDSNPRHNLPVLLALTDLWNSLLLKSNGRIMSPFVEALAAYPAFCATIEAQTCGSASTATHGSSMVIDGGLHHCYDKALYKAGGVLSSELVMAMDSQTLFNTSPTDVLSGMSDDVRRAQDLLVCSAFAHADELAFGSADGGHNTSYESFDDSSKSALSDGNRPSSLLICDRCDAFACGQLAALAEHRAVVKARIWDVDPFAREVGSSMRRTRTDGLKESLDKMYLDLATGEGLDNDNEVAEGQPDNLSTRTMLRHYANKMKDQRTYAVST